MKLAKGDMFKSHCDVLLVTGNATVKNNGAVVMSRGAALQCREAYYGCDKAFGAAIKDQSIWRSKPYKIVTWDLAPDITIGLVQVKWRYESDAEMSLIEVSLNELEHRLSTVWRKKTVFMNFPGIGAGHLQSKRGEILAMLEQLPNNLTVWEYK